MTPCQSFLFSENGLLILKQLVLITFFIQKYLYLFSYHCLVLVSIKMIEILQTTQLERNLLKIEKKVTRHSHHRTVSFRLGVSSFFILALYISCDTLWILFIQKKRSLILKHLVLITLFIQNYLYVFSCHTSNLGSHKMTEILQTTQLERYLFKIENKITR